MAWCDVVNTEQNRIEWNWIDHIPSQIRELHEIREIFDWWLVSTFMQSTIHSTVQVSFQEIIHFFVVRNQNCISTDDLCMRIIFVLVPLHFKTVHRFSRLLNIPHVLWQSNRGFPFSSNEQFSQKVIWSSRLQLDYSWHCYSYITFIYY